ncbi:hypothetical protein [Myceligenerans salitolerans]|uniref:Uncharacterized protein n=1 Tax=Myceligenerans salitolerans TaxID=1230528 RepID=A0ABS3IDR6_9MICO|nr:hypothetical protein [Myceligenerans salitolerans]MBO0611167.1 hypothetical protein [Myceligenerans salitolerans]
MNEALSMAAVASTRWAEIVAAAPSPDPTEGVLRPGLEETDITPGLVGFLVTFAVAVACVFLFLSLTRHLRKARRNAEEQGLDVERRKGIEIRRDVDHRPPADRYPRDSQGHIDIPPGGVGPV